MGIERGRGGGGGGAAFWDLTGDILQNKSAIGEIVHQLGDAAGAKSDYLEDSNGQVVIQRTSLGEFIQKSATYVGGFSLKLYEALVDLSGATEITIAIPTNVVILGVAFVVKTAITGSGGLTDWSADFTGGSTLPIVSTQALTKNTKVEKVHAGIETTATTQIEISANGSETFSTGEIVAVAIVREITPLASFA